MNLPIPTPGFDAARWRNLSLTERMLMIAAYLCDHERVCEEPPGSNRGPWVDTFLRSARVEPPNAWCAAFVTYALVKAGKDPYGEDYGQGVRYPARVSSWTCWADATGRVRSQPKRGCLFIPKGISHIGMVRGVDGDRFMTIEGNSNTDGSRNGEKVVRHERSIESCRFISLEGL